MDSETLIPMLVALIGALGLKEGWNIWKKKIDNSASFKSSLREDNRKRIGELEEKVKGCLLYTSPSPRDRTRSRMPSSA